MSPPIKSSPATSKGRTPRAPSGTFDVVSVLGTVHIGEGDESPTMAAFRLIAEHDSPGTFTFPNAWGGETRVSVEAPPPWNGDDGGNHDA